MFMDIITLTKNFGIFFRISTNSKDINIISSFPTIVSVQTENNK